MFNIFSITAQLDKGLLNPASGFAVIAAIDWLTKVPTVKFALVDTTKTN